MEPTMKLEDDCSNCANHEQGNFNRPPCDVCLDSTSTFGSIRYPNWKAKESLRDLRVRLEEERGISGYLKAVEGVSKAVSTAKDVTPMAKAVALSKYITKDAINPDHYKVGGIETIDYIKAKMTPEEFRGYLRGCTLKYLSRMGHKDSSTQDVSKALWYANRLLGEL